MTNRCQGKTRPPYPRYSHQCTYNGIGQADDGQWYCKRHLAEANHLSEIRRAAREGGPVTA